MPSGENFLSDILSLLGIRSLFYRFSHGQLGPLGSQQLRESIASRFPGQSAADIDRAATVFESGVRSAGDVNSLVGGEPLSRVSFTTNTAAAFPGQPPGTLIAGITMSMPDISSPGTGRITTRHMVVVGHPSLTTHQIVQAGFDELGNIEGVTSPVFQAFVTAFGVGETDVTFDWIYAT